MTQTSAATTALIGRHGELATLTDQLADAVRDQGGTVLISGDPGVGKTRLITEFAAVAQREGARFLYGCANEFEHALPYGPLGAALERPLSTLGPDELASMAGPSWPRLGLLFPSLAAAAEAGSGERAHAYFVLARTLTAWSERQPLVLVIDDAHWADEGTLELVSVLAGRLAETRCLLLLAYRGRPPELTARAASFFDELERGQSATKLTLGPLDREGCAGMVADLTGHTGSDALAEQVFTATGGNAFYVEQTVRAVLESGAADRGGSAGDGTVLPTPAGIARYVTERIRRLGGPAQAVAEVLSAMRSLRVDGPMYPVVGDVTGLDEPDLEAALDDLVGAGVLAVRNEDTIEFAQPIIRTLTREELGVARRRGMHRRLADGLRAAREGGAAFSAVDVAMHVAKGARTGERDAVEELAAAGDETLARAPAVAATWYAQATRLVPASDPVRRAELSARQARALFLSDELADAVRIARDAWPNLVGQAKAAAAGIAVAALTGVGRLDEALREVDRALAATEDSEGRGQLLGHRMGVLLYLGRLREAESAGQEALRLIGDDTAARVRVTRQLAQAAFAAGDLAGHRRLHDQAFRLAEGSPAGLRVSVLSYGGICNADAGDLTVARQLLEEAEELSEEYGTPVYRPLVDTGLATVRWLEGRWDDAVARCLKAAGEAERQGRAEALGSWPCLVTILVDRGELAQARRQLARAQHTPAGVNQLVWPYLVWSRAHLERLTGRPADAVALLEQVLHTGRTPPPVVLDELVAAALEADQPGTARQAMERLAELTTRYDTPYVHGLAERARLLTDGDLVAGHRARERFTELGTVFERARTELAVGRATGDAGLLDGAYRTFDSLTAHPWRRRAGAALRDVGAPVPRRRRRSAEAGLSELEHHIAQLVAEGLPNREIGAMLSISPRTVESYLSRVYVKTGCTSRTDLATAIVTGRISLGEAAD
ncbi:helix-turn-helix transcriptional regulator [Streptomyces luteolus]|uniref:AAA family ATPase n=1 Tax=Streptomyces luteolus TaxID=3043615 RepID=A0ABT6SR62_9ACTN|nr:LuxR family transcriptional regulator [Streptomyces sp. B-S-A12]MDI3417608.1 AAA family ATPase [Streptomyces sp. B-S-A12]